MFRNYVYIKERIVKTKILLNKNIHLYSIDNINFCIESIKNFG